jgi:hypothetical protein
VEPAEFVHLSGNTVTSATIAGKQWLTTHGHTVNGKTVLEVGGKARTLPHASLGKLIADVHTP